MRAQMRKCHLWLVPCACVWHATAAAPAYACVIWPLNLRARAQQKGEDQQKLAREIMERVADSLEALRLAQDNAEQ
jgi:hypothetical protein